MESTKLIENSVLSVNPGENFPLLDKITNNADGNKKSDRFQFHKLRYITQKISEETRISNCGRLARHGTEIEIWCDHCGKSFYKNLFQCGSVWSCPHCRYKIMITRRSEIKTICKAAQKAGLFMGFLGLTCQHNKYNDVKSLKEQFHSINEAWRYLMGIPSLRKLMKGAGFEYIKSLDNRYNKVNGYHPHFHIIVFANTREDAQMICDLIIDYWLKAFPGSLPDYQSYQPVFDSFDEKLESYMTKAGLSDEMTDPCLSKKSKDSINPLDVLSYLLNKDFSRYSEAECVTIYREYSKAVKGLRSITWSKGLKQRFNVAEVTDEEIIHNDEALKHCEIKLSQGVFELLQENKAIHEVLRVVDKCLAYKDKGKILSKSIFQADFFLGTLISELRKEIFDKLGVQVVWRWTNKLSLTDSEYEYTELPGSN
jgi:DNA-directed RNA polymerase subunit RPC12/RpoP